jgi:hypothetical protein
LGPFGCSSVAAGESLPAVAGMPYHLAIEIAQDS